MPARKLLNYLKDCCVAEQKVAAYLNVMKHPGDTLGRIYRTYTLRLVRSGSK